MQRNEWNFHYSGKQLLNAAKAKVTHHSSRYNWWLTRKDSLFKTIRSEGLEVSEAEALQHSGHKARDWNQGALGFHAEQLDSFQGWTQVFEANPESNLPLDHSDWLFFFGRDQ